MNLRRRFVPRQLLFLLTASLITPGARPALSQEMITLRNGQVEQITGLRVTKEGIEVQMGAGAVMTQPFSNVTSVTMNPPPEYDAAQTAYEKGDLKTALANATSVVANYHGLPIDWAQQAILLLGDIYVSMNQLPQAEAVYTDFQKTYPGAGADDVTVGLAQIDVARKDYAAAGKMIEPIVAQALKQRTPSAAASAMYGRAFYVSGQIKEHGGDLQAALEDYLRTAAVFPQDRVAAASAQQRADAIRKDSGIAVP